MHGKLIKQVSSLFKQRYIALCALEPGINYTKATFSALKVSVVPLDHPFTRSGDLVIVRHRTVHNQRSRKSEPKNLSTHQRSYTHVLTHGSYSMDQNVRWLVHSSSKRHELPHKSHETRSRWLPRFVD